MNQSNLISKIETMTNFEVTESIDRVFKTERNSQANFILLLCEISERKLHIAMGYSSLMVYCVQHFQLTEFSAYRRMQIARVAKKFPALVEAIRGQKVSLTTAAMIAPKLKENSVAEQIGECSGKSKEQVKRILAVWEPKADVKESVRHLKASDKNDPISAHVFPAPGTNSDVTLNNFSGFFATPTVSEALPKAKEEVKPLSADRTCLRFSIKADTEEKLKRAQEISGANRLDDVLDLLLEAYLEKKDPSRREARREKRAEKKESRSEETAPRTATPRLKDKALARVGHQCSYVSADGNRCAERTRLELEHIKPRGRGGDNSEGNLTILCKSHNLYLAELHYGREKMRGFSGRRDPSLRSG
jgi:hypothetical protein